MTEQETESYQQIEMIAALTLNLYRSVTTGNESSYQAQLRSELQHIRPGDVVVDIADWHRAAEERVGTVEHVYKQHGGSDFYVVKSVNGRTDVWRNAKLIKVLDTPFNMVSAGGG